MLACCGGGLIWWGSVGGGRGDDIGGYESDGEGTGKCTRVTSVGISLDLSLCDFQVAFVGHLVEGIFAAAEEFAGVAVAVLIESVGFFFLVL